MRTFKEHLEHLPDYTPPHPVNREGSEAARPIKTNKFRMYDTRLKEMAFIGYHVCGEVTALQGMEIHIVENKHRTPECESTLERWNDFIEMQFIGKQDVKGVDIYEGDIIPVIVGLNQYAGLSVGKEEVLNGYIEYNKIQCRYQITFPANNHNIISQDLGWGSQVLNVIGNIYENRELL